MAKITSQIPAQRFETIRDQIGVILTLELAAQTEAASFNVWSERFIPFDTSELDAINVLFDNASYENHNPKDRDGEDQYFIDILVNAKHTGNTKAKKGDTIARKKVSRVAGIVAYILSSAEYYTLGFVPGIIGSRWVSDIVVGVISDQDATHTAAARVTFKVKAREIVGDLTGVLLTEINSQVKLNETDKGFLYELIT